MFYLPTVSSLLFPTSLISLYMSDPVYKSFLVYIYSYDSFFNKWPPMRKGREGEHHTLFPVKTLFSSGPLNSAVYAKGNGYINFYLIYSSAWETPSIYSSVEYVHCVYEQTILSSSILLLHLSLEDNCVIENRNVLFVGNIGFITTTNERTERSQKSNEKEISILC